MKKINRRKMIIGTASAGISAIAAGLFVSSARAETELVTFFHTPDSCMDDGGGDVPWDLNTYGNIAIAGNYVKLTDTIGRYDETNFLYAYDYDFVIPSDATINGVTAKYAAGADADKDYTPWREVYEMVICLVRPYGVDDWEYSPSLTPVADPPSSSLTRWTSSLEDHCHDSVRDLIYVGGDAETWFNDGLTPAQVNSQRFGLAIKAENPFNGDRCAWMDKMELKIAYTIPQTSN